MIVTLTGNNPFALKQKLDEISSKFIAKYSELALERIDAEEADAAAILDAVQSLPFLTKRKMVVVRSLSSNKSAVDQIEQIISSISGSTDLVLYEPLTDKRTIYFKTLKAKTQLEEYNKLDAPSLVKWLLGEAKKRGGKLVAGEATFLVDRVGTNQALLSNELDKLITYAPKITRANIELLIEPTPQSKIFDLLDAAFGGNKSRALQLYADQRAQKVEPQAILAMLTWQLQLLSLTKLADGRSVAEIAKDSGMSPYPIMKADKLAAKLTDAKLKNMVSEAFSIDWRSKTTALDLDEALKTYIVAL